MEMHADPFVKIVNVQILKAWKMGMKKQSLAPKGETLHKGVHAIHVRRLAESDC